MDLVDIDKALDDLELHQEHEKLQEEQQLQQQQQRVATVAAPMQPTPVVAVAPAGALADKEAAPRSNVSNVFQSLNEYVNCGTTVEQQPATATLARLERYEPMDAPALDDKREVEPVTEHEPTVPAEHEPKEAEHEPKETAVLETELQETEHEPQETEHASTVEAEHALPRAPEIHEPEPTADRQPEPAVEDISDDGSSGSPLLLSVGRRPRADGQPFDRSNSSSDLGSLVVASSHTSSLSSSARSTSTSSSNDDDPTGLAGRVQYESQIDDEDDNRQLVDDDDQHEDDDDSCETTSVSMEPLNVDDDGGAQPEPVAPAANTTVNPVGFESTMDDVSDAELESYLMELEMETGGAAGGGDSSPAAGDDGVALPEHKAEASASQPDTFSLASTVEFGPHDDDGQPDEPIQLEETPIVPAELEDVFHPAAVDATTGHSAALSDSGTQDPSIVEAPKPTVVMRLSSGEYEPECPNNNNNNNDEGSNNFNQHQAVEMPMQVKPGATTTTTKKKKEEADGQEKEEDGNEYESMVRAQRPVTLMGVRKAPIVASVSPVDQVPDHQAPSPPHFAAVKPTTLNLQGPTTAPEPVDTPESTERTPGTGTPPPPPASSCDTQLTSSSSDDFEPPSYASITNMSTPPSGDLSAPPTPPASHQQHQHLQLLGSVPPYWIPDAEATACMLCQVRFSLIKRRHHCRCCGLVLCSGCCSLKAKLAYMGGEQEARVCVQCDVQLSAQAARAHEIGQEAVAPSPHGRPNPNNPMEYCSQISPLLQSSQARAGSGGVVPPSSSGMAGAAAGISVMVPVGVLKRQGAAKSGVNRAPKNVMFSDGIRPGCDLTDLDHSWDQKTSGAEAATTTAAPAAAAKSSDLGGMSSSSSSSSEAAAAAAAPASSKTTASSKSASKIRRPPVHAFTQSYIGKGLPPIYESVGSIECRYVDVTNDAALLKRLHSETLRFAVQRNLYVLVRIVHLSCCINKTVINFTTQGMHHVGQDEIVILLETDDTIDQQLPRDIFVHLNEIYQAADNGTTVGELGFSMAGPSSTVAPATMTVTTTTTTVATNNNDHAKSACATTTSSSTTTSSTTTTSSEDIIPSTLAHRPPADGPPFLGHKEHGGFLHIRPTFQCLQSLIVPDNPFLIAILIHRWEVPWAKIFPLRLMLRLGALYRYYPCPHVSVRGRDSVYAEIAQTIINFLADFRTYSYTLAAVRGLRIHMEDRTTLVLVPRNRYDQVQKALANSSDHILALAGNFSTAADGHLVCIQNTESGCTETHSYSTQAVNIQGRPRRITGASFLVLNGALKSSSGLSAKCSIVEDGLMVQVMPAKMAAVQKALRDMKDVDIVCGPVDGAAAQTEVVSVKWVENDVDFNVGVTSPIDGKSMAGIPSMRVHRGQDYNNTNHIIRWTEVFMLQADDETNHNKDPVDMSKLSEQISSSASTALVAFLDLMAASGQLKIGLRVTLHMDNVSYEAGSRGARLAPLYMNALDNELIPTLHRAATNLQPEQPIVVELIFHILDE